MERKKKLRIIQFSLFFAGIILFFLIYTNTDKNSQVEIIPKRNKKK